MKSGQTSGREDCARLDSLSACTCERGGRHSGYPGSGGSWDISPEGSTCQAPCALASCAITDLSNGGKSNRALRQECGIEGASGQSSRTWKDDSTRQLRVRGGLGLGTEQSGRRGHKLGLHTTMCRGHQGNSLLLNGDCFDRAE